MASARHRPDSLSKVLAALRKPCGHISLVAYPMRLIALSMQLSDMGRVIVLPPGKRYLPPRESVRSSRIMATACFASGTLCSHLCIFIFTAGMTHTG